MDYRRSSLVLNRQQLAAAANSHIYASFAGAAAVAPPNTNADLSEANIMWWDDERIEATVTRHYVESKLQPDETVRLDVPLDFGGDLTDETYWGWIESKAKRIFLILVELGVPDQIFGVVDDSWDDEDLPISLDQVERLRLTYNKDEKLEKKFFYKQFNYLLRHIQKGDHVIYDDEEVVPLETESKRLAGAARDIYSTAQGWGDLAIPLDKVCLPGKPDDVFYRRKIPLSGKAGSLPQTELLSGIEEMRVIDHEHLTTLWASYVHEDVAYLLLSPVQNSNLKSVLTVQPQSLKILAKLDRRILFLNWMHCLAEALSFLHGKGLSHRNIKPSTVMLDIDNKIFLGDIGVFPMGEKRGFDKESYDYSPPEQAQQPPKVVPSFPNSNKPRALPSGGRRAAGSPTVGNSNASTRDSTMSISNDGASILTDSTGSISSSSSSAAYSFARRSTLNKSDPQKADIFSLGCIILEIITLFLKKSSSSFRSHRGEKNKTPGRGGGIPDSSFHKNPAQVESWMKTLVKDASKKEDKVFRGIKHIVSLAGEMISSDSDSRPNATQVQERLYIIMIEHCGLGAGNAAPSKIHCDAHKVRDNEWNFGFDELRLASQRAAAEACAAVAPQSTETRTLPLGNGGVIYGIERKDSMYEGNAMGGSVATKSSDGKSSNKGNGGGTYGKEKGGQLKPKAKAWQAPVYAGLYLFRLPQER
jgi:serine/threonine protein kinase